MCESCWHSRVSQRSLTESSWIIQRDSDLTWNPKPPRTNTVVKSKRFSEYHKIPQASRRLMVCRHCNVEGCLHCVPAAPGQKGEKLEHCRQCNWIALPGFVQEMQIAHDCTWRMELPGLVNVYKKRTGKIHHAINGKIHYFDWAIFNSFLMLFVCSPEGIVIDTYWHWNSCLNGDAAHGSPGWEAGIDIIDIIDIDSEACRAILWLRRVNVRCRA